jgi:phosphopantetheinyl transferase
MTISRPVWIFLWAQRYSPLSNEQRLLSCAQAYAEGTKIAAAPDFLHLPQPAILRHQGGKPYFPAAPDLHFSLSHSGDYAVCAYHDQPVGLDLQVHSRCNQAAIARRFFRPEENDYLAAKNYESFFAVWAAKESYLKYTGEGIVGGLDQFSVVDGSGLKDKLGEARFYHRELLGCNLCLCTAALTEIKLVDIREKSTIREKPVLEKLSPEKLSPEKLSPEKLSPEKLSPEKLSPESGAR